jgi:hypothetical protein
MTNSRSRGCLPANVRMNFPMPIREFRGSASTSGSHARASRVDISMPVAFRRAALLGKCLYEAGAETPHSCATALRVTLSHPDWSTSPIAASIKRRRVCVDRPS